jgi:hypothetical protein
MSIECELIVHCECTGKHISASKMCQLPGLLPIGTGVSVGITVLDEYICVRLHSYECDVNDGLLRAWLVPVEVAGDYDPTKRGSECEESPIPLSVDVVRAALTVAGWIVR